MDDLISRQAAIDALWKALYEYEDVTEKQFIESEELDVGDWFQHRIFVQNMSDIDRQTILALPSAQPERKTGHWIKTARWGRVYYCDQCRNYLDFDGVNVGRGSTNFCPNCGAKMGEKEKTNETD